jgi:hypothetical protein
MPQSDTLRDDHSSDSTRRLLKQGAAHSTLVEQRIKERETVRGIGKLCSCIGLVLIVTTSVLSFFPVVTNLLHGYIVGSCLLALGLGLFHHLSRESVPFLTAAETVSHSPSERTLRSDPPRASNE